MNWTTISRHCILFLLATASGAALAEQKGNPAAPCFRALSGDPQFALIREKVALGGSAEEMRGMTASALRASPQEVPVLAAWRSARDACHRLEADYYASRDVEIQALAGEHYAAVQALIGELQEGRLTYGDFGRRRLELFEKVNARIEARRREILPAKPAPHLTPGTK